MGQAVRWVVPEKCVDENSASIAFRHGQSRPQEDPTSHVERQNLTIRMSMLRLTRLTNAFSKKWDNLWATYCLHFAYYNFCRIRKTLRVTPAMESNLTDHVWEIAELLCLVLLCYK